MISVIRTKCGISVRDTFFSHDPTLVANSSFIHFFVQAAKPTQGLHRFKTSILDLEQSLGELFNRISSGARYKIRRAEREGIIPEFVASPSIGQVIAFASFFDEFASQKSLPKCNKKKMLALQSQGALALTSASHSAGSTLAMHAYVLDRGEGRLRLLYSASHFRGLSSSEDRNYVGRANRFLHWYEIQRAKELGYSRYDLGGLPINDDDPDKNTIARFKLEFGGEALFEYTGYVSRSALIQRFIPVIQRVVT